MFFTERKLALQFDVILSCICFQLMKGVVPEGEELMPHRLSQDASGTTGNSHPEPELPTPTQAPPIRKRCRNRGLVLHDETVATAPHEVMAGQTVASSTQQVVEDEMAAAMGVKLVVEDNEGVATGAKEVIDDKTVAKYRKEINLTYKRRRLFQDN